MVMCIVLLQGGTRGTCDSALEYGIQVSRSSDRSSIWFLIHTKIHLICPGCPQLALLCNTLVWNTFSIFSTARNSIKPKSCIKTQSLGSSFKVATKEDRTGFKLWHGIQVKVRTKMRPLSRFFLVPLCLSNTIHRIVRVSRIESLWIFWKIYICF